MFSAEEICQYWLDSYVDNESDLEAKFSYWFTVNRKRDRQLRRRFIAYTIMAAEGALDQWADTPIGRLAVLLLMDRFTRASFRNTELAYNNDKNVQNFCLDGIQKGLDRTLNLEQKIFFYFPLVASDRFHIQKKAQPLYSALQLETKTDSESQAIKSLIALNERNLMLLERYKCFPHRKLKAGIALSEEEKSFVETYEWEEWL